MIKITKLLTLFMVFMFAANSSFAFSISKLDKLVKKSDFNETATVAISIKNVDKNEVVYEQNSKKLVHPASTLKIFTAYSSMNMLGDEYFFKTSFLKDSQNNLYIKLGADPFLTTSQLNSAFQTLKDNGYKHFNNLYFDDSILDKKEFATGWMWDDDMNPYTPKVSSYNLDNNVVKLDMASKDDGKIWASLKTTYPMTVVSNIQAGAKKDYIEVNRYNWNNPEVVEVYATIANSRQIAIPISSMRRYFVHNLEKIIDDNRITFEGTKYSSQLAPNNAEVLTQIVHPVDNVYSPILQNSNNLMAETVFKLAGAQKYTATGSDLLATQAFSDFYKKNGISTDDIIIKDGCGVSRNNLIYVDWMTKTLNKMYRAKDFEKFKAYMAQPGDGTLSKRLHDLRGDAWLKTGSLSNVSAIAGYVQSQDGNLYSIAIIIQNFKEEQEKIKAFEDEVIKLIYNR